MPLYNDTMDPLREPKSKFDAQPQNASGTTDSLLMSENDPVAGIRTVVVLWQTIR